MEKSSFVEFMREFVKQSDELLAKLDEESLKEIAPHFKALEAEAKTVREFFEQKEISKEWIDNAIKMQVGIDSTPDMSESYDKYQLKKHAKILAYSILSAAEMYDLDAEELVEELKSLFKKKVDCK